MVEVNTPRLNHSQTGRHSIYLTRRDRRLSWPAWVVKEGSVATYLRSGGHFMNGDIGNVPESETSFTRKPSYRKGKRATALVYRPQRTISPLTCILHSHAILIFILWYPFLHPNNVKYRNIPRKF